MTNGSLAMNDVPVGPSDDEPVARTGPQLRYAGFDTSPTRKVCEAVYYDPELRRRILEVVLIRHRRAWPPNYELDTTAIMRHAWRARRWQLGRDAAMCLVLLLAAGGVATRLMDRGGVRLTVALASLLVLSATTRRVFRWRHVTARSIRKAIFAVLRRRPKQVAVMAAVTFTVLVLYGPAAARIVRPSDLLFLAAGVGVVVVIGIVDAAVVSERASRCRTPGSVHGPIPLLRNRAPRLPAAFEERLATIDDAPEPDQAVRTEGRVILYDLDKRLETMFVNSAFVGSGESLGDFRINIDVSRGQLRSDGTRKDPKSVSVLGLHRTLERFFRESAEPGVWCGHRMYVDDRGLANAEDLQPDPNARPVTRASLGDLLCYLVGPTAYVRTHLCLQIPISRWNGEIIVTLFVRGDLTAKHLTLHNDVLILPGVHLRCRPPAGYPPTDRWTRVTGPLRCGTIAIWPVLMRSPYRILAEARAGLWRQAHRLRMSRHIKHRRELRYGGISSLREDLAKGSRVIHPSAMEDITGAIAFLQHTLKAGLRQYLEQCEIDTSSLDDEVRNVINHQQNRIEHLHAKNVAFGERGHAGDVTGNPDERPSD